MSRYFKQMMFEFLCVTDTFCANQTWRFMEGQCCRSASLWTLSFLKYTVESYLLVWPIPKAITMSNLAESFSAYSKAPIPLKFQTARSEKEVRVNTGNENVGKKHFCLCETWTTVIRIHTHGANIDTQTRPQCISKGKDKDGCKNTNFFPWKSSLWLDCLVSHNSASKLLSHICLRAWRFTRPSCWLSRTALLTNWYLICATTGWCPDYSCVWGRPLPTANSWGISCGNSEAGITLFTYGVRWALKLTKVRL